MRKLSALRLGRLLNEFVRRIIGYDYYRGRAHDEFETMVDITDRKAAEV